MGTIKADTVTGLADPNKITLPSGDVTNTTFAMGATLSVGSTTATLNFGNTVVANASAGSSTITGEGGSNTTNIQQGLAKYWQNLDTTGTAEQRDSFNVSGITDNNTGDITTSFTTNFGNANYSVTSMGGRSGGTASFFIRFNDNVTAPTASAVRFQFIDADGSGTDGDRATTAGHGDLS